MNTTQVTASAQKVGAKVAQESAAQAYERRAEAIACDLDVLAARLKGHSSRAGQDSRNWGYAGDLAEVQELIERAIAMLGGAK